MIRKFKTRDCVFCGKPGTVEVDMTDEQYREFSSPSRRHIQHILPDVSAEIREQLISGTHPACWDELFEDDEND